jgi:hypothetical protein
MYPKSTCECTSEGLDLKQVIPRMLLIASTTLLMAFQLDEGTAEHCDNNSKNPAHACACNVATECHGKGKPEPNRKCTTFCKPEHCHCAAACHIT